MNRAIGCFGLTTLSACALLYGQQGQDCINYMTHTGNLQTISVIDFGNFDPSLINGALSRWNSNCPQSAEGSFPTLMSIPGGDVNLAIEGVDQVDMPGSCGGFSPYPETGALECGVIALAEHTPEGEDCSPERLRTLVHELGHLLGLDDYNCSDYIDYVLGPRLAGGGSLDIPNANECIAVDWWWWTPIEQERQDAENRWSCEQFCQGTCERDWGGNYQCIEGQPSPIIVDIGGDGYHLTGVAGVVQFDLDLDGHLERTSWTSDGDDAFLCLDIDRDGRITSGRELFGNYTILPDQTQAENGFIALGWYDRREAGGNGNGSLDPGDVVWGLLRLWRDTNHDGISQPTELVSLDAAGVVEIGTTYHEQMRRDRFGDRFRYRGHILVLDTNIRVHSRLVYDVFLVTEE